MIPHFLLKVVIIYNGNSRNTQIINIDTPHNSAGHICFSVTRAFHLSHNMY